MPLPEEDQTEILSTEKALDSADQAIDNMQPALGIAVATANSITTVLDAIDSAVSIYKMWEKVIATMKDVMIRCRHNRRGNYQSFLPTDD